jgi:hypothetical protein
MADAPYLPVPKTRDENEPTALIFSLQQDDGSVYECRVPNRARPSLGYGYMRRIRKEGKEAAEAWLMEKVLGDEALTVLENYDDLTPAQNASITARIRDVAMGGLQSPSA